MRWHEASSMIYLNLLTQFVNADPAFQTMVQTKVQALPRPLETYTLAQIHSLLNEWADQFEAVTGRLPFRVSHDN